MNELQKTAMRKFTGDSWVVDTNIKDEPIVYVHTGNQGWVNEYVIDNKGTAVYMTDHPYTVKLKKELELISKGKF